MKSAAILSLACLAALATPVWAGPCDEELPALTAAVAQAKLEPDAAAQIKDMIAQAQKLCQAGNEEEASDVLSEASSILEGQ